MGVVRVTRCEVTLAETDESLQRPRRVWTVLSPQVTIPAASELPPQIPTAPPVHRVEFSTKRLGHRDCARVEYALLSR